MSTKSNPGAFDCYAAPLLWRMAHNPNRKIAGRLQDLVEAQQEGALL